MTNKELLEQHSIYKATIASMTQYQNAYLGGSEFKRNVRSKRSHEDVNQYNEVINNTVAQPICRYIVDRINDTVFDTGATRNISFSTPTGNQAIGTDWAEVFLLDCNMQNQSIESFMESVSQTASIYGHCYVFVDTPAYGDNIRPYVTLISPTQVWDWEYENFQGRMFLSYIKVLEEEEDDCYYFIEYKLGNDMEPTSWKRWEVEKGTPNGEATLLEEGVYAMGITIPGFVVYGRRDPRIMDVGVSDIDVAVEAQRQHYALETEAYLSVIYAKTLLRAKPGMKIPAHAGGIVRGEQGDLEAIEVATNDVDKIRAQQESILKNILDLTGLSGTRSTTNQVHSGIALMEERKTLHNVAKSKARLLEIAEELIMTFAARLMGVRFTGEIKYNTNYSGLDETYRLALLEKAVALAPMDPTIQAMVAKELVSMLTVNEPSPRNYQPADAITQVPFDPESLLPEEPEDAEDVTTMPAIIDTGVSYTAQQSVNMGILGR